jgi:hypothetical protein
MNVSRPLFEGQPRGDIFMTNPHKYHGLTDYRIKLKEHLDPKWSGWFEQMAICTQGDQTILAGEEIFNAFKEEIADILEMVDFSIDNTSYQYEWDKSLHPVCHFKMSARDMAKFGVLYQKNRNRKGLQVIASNWIDESNMAYSKMENSNGLGYGYMWKIIPVFLNTRMNVLPH